MHVSIRSLFCDSCRGGAALLVLSGCPFEDVPTVEGSSSGAESTATVGTVCSPGQQVACPCPGGGEGAQVCAPDGNSYEPCQCDPSADESTTAEDDTATTTTGTTTTSTTEATDTNDPSGSTSTDTTGEPSCDRYMGGVGTECDPWLQDCPDGEKCSAWAEGGETDWNATRCVPISSNPAQPGDECTVVDSATSGEDDCDIGAMCWEVDPDTLLGFCVALCAGCPADPVCEDPTASCLITNDGVVTLCLP